MIPVFNVAVGDEGAGKMDWYGLAMCATPGGPRSALVHGDATYDLAALGTQAGLCAEDCARLMTLDSTIAQWNQTEDLIERIAEDTARKARTGTLEIFRLATPRYLAPFVPYRIFGAASNYIEHAAEMETKLAAKADSTPFIFLKSQGSVIGPGEPIVIPPESQKVDWEVELGVVIGHAARRLAFDKASSAIAGYVIINDISARDQTRRTDFPFSHDWFRGKSFDTFSPLGPWFVPRRVIPDPHDLGLRLWVNESLMQNGRSDEMIFNTYEQIVYLSKWLTLRPGDLLATGTPAGVGMARGVFLKAGDVVHAEIDGLGRLTNPVIDEVT